MKNFYNKNKLLLWVLFAFCVLVGILSSVNAYSTYPGTSGGAMNYSTLATSVGLPNSTNLGDLSYLESLFDYSKQYYSSFSSLGTFEDFSHIAITYDYRPSNNDNFVLIWYSYSPIINRPGVNQNTQQNTFTGTGNAILAISVDMVAQTAKYHIYYDFTSTQYIVQTSSIISLQGGTVYGYLSNNNTYSNSIISDYYTMKTLNTIAYFGTYYNPNLLDNDPRFKKICVNNQRSLFSVIPDNIDLSVDGLYSDYMLVPSFVRGIQYGDLYYNFSSGNSNLLYMSSSNGDLNTFLQQYDFISSDYMSFIKNTPEMVAFRQKYGDLYNQLYGWAVFPLKYMLYHSALDSTVREWSTFVYFLESAYTEGVKCDSVIIGGSTYCEETNHGGGGREPGVVPILEDTCFYIPSDYTYKLWAVNDYGDITDTLTIDNSNFSINSDYFENEYNDFQTDNSYSGYLGYFKYLLSKCATPIGFINAKLTLFFNKLPELVRYLIVSLIVIGLLVGIIKFLTGGK